MGALTITWLGHASFMLEDGLTVLIDPWISGNPACTRSLEDFQKVDLICVTHGHNDHLGDSLPLCKRTGAKLICSPEIGIYATRHGLDSEEGSHPLDIGGAYRAEGIEINMVHALHTADILGEEFDRDGTVMPGSGCCGYVVRMGEGPAVYHAGDTGVFGDMKLIGDLYGPDVALLPIGGRYTMGIREAACAAKLLAPRILIPIHYDTLRTPAV